MIQFVRKHKNFSFRQASEFLGLKDCGDEKDHLIHHNHLNDYIHPIHHNAPPPLQPPGETWTAAAQAFVARWLDGLWSGEGAKALAWLHRRGLNDETIRNAGLGYNAADQYVERQSWGLAPENNAQGRPKRLWLPRGIVIPWLVDGELWGLRIRRPVGDPKYYWVPGGTSNTLYNADTLSPGKPAMILEGEIDALTVQQQAGDLIAAVATGSTHAARRTKWLARLSLAQGVLVGYDSDEAGEAAAGYWVDSLENAKRWRPFWSDVNDLAIAGVNVRAWVAAGLGLPSEVSITAEQDLTSYVGETVDHATWTALQTRLQSPEYAGWTITGEPVADGVHITRLHVS